ncbi:GntR family transcriptional regulator [Oryzibacter oryziterrae]|uniref:GntR family transcriptional regulator n=1 Tax=Oryzibacter oryziterrae TaxID=2766474 RepID=UPI001F41FEBD|nr:GntR family transcriptional regulator [Oryzibacter oryziterrae]
MRSDAIFKRAYNQMLALIADVGVGAALPGEIAITRELDVSRTTARKIVDQLSTAGIVGRQMAEGRLILRLPAAVDHFPDSETEAGREIVERGFMELIQIEAIVPGQLISTADIARRLAVSPTVVREYLEGFRQYGLIERQANGGWVFLGFDQDFARELSDFREMIEVRAAEAFAGLALDDPAWSELGALEQRHRDMQADFAATGHLFPHLDQEFHSLINAALKNRFVDNFNDIKTFIFHYHYQWSRADENERNAVALREHLDYIAALWTRDPLLIRAAVTKHLRSARISLLAAMQTHRG